MRIISRIFALALAASMLLPIHSVFAASSAEYLDIVKSRCEATKQLIDEQRRSDLVARINKGRAYQTIIDQQNALSLRLRNNKITSDVFDRQITAAQDKLSQFREAYRRYDDALDKLLDIDCKTQPQDFVDQLVLARSLRQIVGNEVAAIDTELAVYRQQVVRFKQDLERLNSNVSGGLQ
jgi:hypothetical protein